MDKKFSVPAKKIISLICAFLLVFGLLTPSFTNTVNAETEVSPTNDYIIEKELYFLNDEKQEIVLNQEIVNIENQINDYLDEIPYTEEEFEAMSEEEFEEVYNTYFNDIEFLNLENEHEEAFKLLEAQQGNMQPRIAPILVPILANVARVALQTVVKQGTRVASTYLKKHLKTIGKNYSVKWNVKNSQGKVTTLLMIQHKPTKQPVFRLDNGSLHAHLTPGTSTWYWHFHIGGTPTAMKQHYSLRSIIPSKYKPKSSLTLY